MRTLQKHVARLIRTDDSYSQLNDANIRRIYNNADNETKNVIDDIFINLTGYSLNTIVLQVVVDDLRSYGNDI